WSLAGSGDRPPSSAAGFSVVDSVDVEDLESEARHAYVWRTAARDRLRELSSGGPDGPLAIDGGRWISEGGGRSIRAEPGRRLLLVMRTESERDASIDVTVDGRPAGRLEAPAREGVWSEPSLEIPAGLVKQARLTIRLGWVADPRGDGYNS